MFVTCISDDSAYLGTHREQIIIPPHTTRVGLDIDSKRTIARYVVVCVLVPIIQVERLNGAKRKRGPAKRKYPRRYRFHVPGNLVSYTPALPWQPCGRRRDNCAGFHRVPGYGAVPRSPFAPGGYCGGLC